MDDGRGKPNCKDDEEAQMLADLVPPITGSEQFRDVLLRFLDTPFVQFIGILVLVSVVLDGAFFFFLMVGWHNMCSEPSRLNCDPRNYWLNWSLQVLNILFTYMSIQRMVWTTAQFLHIAGFSCPRRSNAIGCNLYGIPDDPDIWYYIPIRRRLWIVILIVVNCVSQFLNQATRIIYLDYSSSNTMPGQFWVNVFFVASMASNLIAVSWVIYEMGLVRTANPSKFEPGPLDSIRAAIAAFRKTKRTPDDGEDEGDESLLVPTARVHPDPTRARSRRVLVGLGESRASARFFAM